MAAQLGTIFKIYLTNELVALCKSNKLSATRNMVDVTTKESGEWTEVKPGLMEFNGSVEGFIEHKNTNLLAYSEQFNNAAWQKVNGATVSANSTTNPYGQNTADTINIADPGDLVVQQITHTVSIGDTYTYSVWLRAASAGTITMQLRNGDQDEGTTVSISVTTSWVLYSISKTFTQTDTGLEVNIQNNTGDTLNSVYAWAAQLEVGAAPTTYQATPRINATQLYDIMAAGTAKTMLATTNINGGKQFSGTCYISDVNFDTAVGEAETFSATLKGTATLTQSTTSI